MHFEWLASQFGRVHLCGHRGYSTAAPENTMAALEAAHRAGATECETDVALTADDVPVIIHDLTLDRTTSGKGRVRAMTLDELRRLDAGSWFSPNFAGERIPTLREYLDFAVTHNVGLVIEAKDHLNFDKMWPRIAEDIAATDALGHATLLSFDHTELAAAKNDQPKLRTEGITHARHCDFVGVARSARLDSLSIEFAMFNPEDAKALHSAGVAIRCHLPAPAKMEHLDANGFDIAGRASAFIKARAFDTVSGDDIALMAALC